MRSRWRIFLVLSVIGLSLDVVEAASEAATKPTLQPAIRHAQALQDQGRLADAQHAYELLLTQLESHPPSPELGYVLNALSQISSGNGDYATAIRNADRAASVYRRLSNIRGEGNSFNIKGLAEVAEGEYEKAEADFETALTLSRRAHDVQNEIQILNNQGSSRFFQGKYFEALQDYAAALLALQRNTAADWNSYWVQITNFNQATLYQRLGRYEVALQIYRGVEASSKSLTAGDRAHLYGNLGALYRRLGDPWKALESYTKAQAFYSQQHDSDGEIGVLKNIGIVYALDLADLPRAQGIFERVMKLAIRTRNRREEMQAHLYLGETQLRKALPPAAAEEFQQALAIARELGTTEEQWKALFGLAKTAAESNPAETESRLRDAISIIEKARSKLQLAALRAEFLGDKRNVYDSLISLLLHQNRAADAFLVMERSRSRTFQDRLAQKRNPLSESPTLAAVQRRLPGQTALLDFWTAGDELGLIWCTREKSGASLIHLPAADRGRIQEIVKSFTTNTGKEQSGSVLSSLIPQDVLRQIDAKHLVLIPDGWLSSVPFELLPVAPDSRTLLIEQYDVSYLPSASLLFRPQVGERRWYFPWTRQLVAFGDPIVGQPHAFPDPAKGESIRPLPASRGEILAIAKMMQGKSELLLSGEDLKPAFLGGRANSAFLLHISTHAFADIENPEGSWLLFSPQTSQAEPASVYLRELYEMNLDSVRLATLSACDTERGKMIAGEGVQAFGRALLAAGARSSLTTLWRVEDQPTAEFMKQFYFFLVSKRASPAEALQLAKLKFLRSGAGLEHPTYWAAFVLNGDGQTPLPRVISWKELTAVATILLGLLWATARLLRHWRRIHR